MTTKPPGLASRRRVTRWSAVGLVVALAAGAGAWWLRDTGMYLWTTRRAELTWQCSTDILLPFTTGAGRYSWRAPQPTTTGTGHFLTSPPLPTLPIRTHHATGRVRFESLNRATFHSDAGESLVFIRERKHAFHNLGCGIGGELGS